MKKSLFGKLLYFSLFYFVTVFEFIKFIIIIIGLFMFLNPYVYIDNNDDLKIMNIFCRIIIYLRERERF